MNERYNSSSWDQAKACLSLHAPLTRNYRNFWRRIFGIAAWWRYYRPRWSLDANYWDRSIRKYGTSAIWPMRTGKMKIHPQCWLLACLAPLFRIHLSNLLNSSFSRNSFIFMDIFLKSGYILRLPSYISGLRFQNLGCTFLSPIYVSWMERRKCKFIIVTFAAFLNI